MRAGGFSKLVILCGLLATAAPVFATTPLPCGDSMQELASDGPTNGWLRDRLLLAKQGDKRALDEALAAMREPLVRHLQGRLRGSPEVSLAEDFAHSALIAVARNIEGFADSGSARGWFFIVAQNEMLAHLRKKSSQQKQLAEDFDVSHSADAPEASLVQSEGLAKLRTAIDSLEPAYRDVIDLLLQGNTMQEIADLREIPLGTVLTRARRARFILKERLGEDP